MMATCWFLNEVGANMHLTLITRAKFDRGWDYKCMAVRRSFAVLISCWYYIHTVLPTINNLYSAHFCYIILHCLIRGGWTWLIFAR